MQTQVVVKVSTYQFSLEIFHAQLNEVAVDLLIVLFVEDFFLTTCRTSVMMVRRDWDFQKEWR